jgi:hypothetical protein
MRLDQYDPWCTKKILSTLSKHESRMFWFVHFFRSFKGRALISNIFHCRQYQRDRETALSETKMENGLSEVSENFRILRSRVMGNSPSIHSQYMTLLKGLLKGSRVNVKDKSFQELFQHVHCHSIGFILKEELY